MQKNEAKQAEIDEENELANYEDVINEYTNPELKSMKLVINSGASKAITLPITPNEENNYTISGSRDSIIKVEQWG